jgi:hypothetical protein
LIEDHLEDEDEEGDSEDGDDDEDGDSEDGDDDGEDYLPINQKPLF